MHMFWPPLLLDLLLLLLCRYSLLRAFEKTQNDSLLRRLVLRDASRVVKQQQQRRRRRRWRRRGSSSGQLPIRSLGLAVVLCLRCRACVCSFCVCVHLVVPRCPGCAVSASG